MSFNAAPASTSCALTAAVTASFTAARATEDVVTSVVVVVLVVVVVVVLPVVVVVGCAVVDEQPANAIAPTAAIASIFLAVTALTFTRRRWPENSTESGMTTEVRAPLLALFCRCAVNDAFNMPHCTAAR